MDLNETAVGENLDDVTQADILAWATTYLPDPSAEAFAEWLNSHLGDWENEAISIHEVLTGAYQQWTGGDLPAPDCPHGYRLTDTCPVCDHDD